MTKCHRRDISVLTLTVIPFLACIVAVATISFRSLSSSVTLQPPFREHLQVLQHRTAADSTRFLSPGAASFRGRRPYQEDRIVCSPGIHIPHASARNVGLFGVFDGHLGDTASDFAASSIVERFLHHSSYGMASLNMSSTVLQRLEGALLAAISDIDSAFGKSAAVHGYKSGSTACVSLKVDSNIIVANLGDSRAFFCSACEKQYYRKRFKGFHDPFSNQHALRPNQGSRHQIARRLEDTALHPHSEGFCVKSLTSDHRPDRPDEKLRIKALGGFVTEGSIPRVNGQLAVSRSIGDIDFRKYGVISEPEVSGWHQVSEDDKFLIIASDGIFEKFSPEEVCNVLHALRSGKDLAWIMNFLGMNGGNVIALPGTDFRPDASAQVSKESSSQDAHEHRSAEPLLSSHFEIEQGKDGLQMTSTPFLHGASSYAQILARLSLEIAFRAGSMDNLSIVIVPLMP